MPTDDRRAARFRAVEAGIFGRHLPGAEEHRCAWTDGEVRVVEIGSGPPIVFLHGVTGTLTNFASLAGEFRETNRCLLVDLPGHGLSGPLDLDGTTPRAALVDAVRSVIDQRAPAETPVLVGNSLGGMTALYVAADAPDAVAAVAVLGEPAYAFAGARARFPLDVIGRPFLGRASLAAPPPPLPIYRRMIRQGFGDRALARIDTDVLDANRLAVWAGRHAASVSGLMRALMGRRGLAAPGVPLTAADIDQIDVPVWFLWGDDDPFMSPAEGRPYVEQFHDAVLDVIDGSHVPWFDAPALTRSRIGELTDEA